VSCKKEKIKKRYEWDAQNLDIVPKNNKIDKKKESKKQTKRQPNHAFARLNQKPHKSQMKNKMLKKKRNNRSMANDVNDIKRKENTRGINLYRTS
jgi:hypothetical protein